MLGDISNDKARGRRPALSTPNGKPSGLRQPSARRACFASPPMPSSNATKRRSTSTAATTPSSTAAKRRSTSTTTTTTPRQRRASTPSSTKSKRTPRRRSSVGSDDGVRMEVVLRVRRKQLPTRGPASTGLIVIGNKALLVPPPSSRAYENHVYAEEVDFDAVLAQEADQGAVFAQVGQPLADGLLGGSSACVLTFGATGSGKTHTMFGDDDGLIPRTCAAVVAAAPEGATLEVACVEVVCDTYRDLFLGEDVSPSVGRHPAALPVDLHWRPVALDDVHDVVGTARDGRRQASTDCNASSSRGHVAFFMRLAGSDAMMALIDVGGNERLHMSGATGDRAKEAGAINSSLSGIRRVVEALKHNTNHPEAPVLVPFRGNKLTALLKPLLTMGLHAGPSGGRCVVLMTATDDLNDFDVTRSVLKFACDARETTVQATATPRQKRLKKATQGAQTSPLVTTGAGVQTSPGLIRAVVRRAVIKQVAAGMVQAHIAAARLKAANPPQQAHLKAQLAALHVDVERRTLALSGLSRMLAVSQQTARETSQQSQALAQKLMDVGHEDFVRTVRQGSLPTPARPRRASIDTTTPATPRGRGPPRETYRRARSLSREAPPTPEPGCGGHDGSAVLSRLAGFLRRTMAVPPASEGSLQQQLRAAKLSMTTLFEQVDRAQNEKKAAFQCLAAAQQEIASLQDVATIEAERRAELATQLAALTQELQRVTAERDAAWRGDHHPPACVAACQTPSTPTADVHSQTSLQSPNSTASQGSQTVEWGVFREPPEVEEAPLQAALNATGGGAGELPPVGDPMAACRTLDESIMACRTGDDSVMLWCNTSVLTAEQAGDGGDGEDHHCSCCLRKVLKSLPALMAPPPKPATPPRLDKATRQRWWALSASGESAEAVVPQPPSAAVARPPALSPPVKASLTAAPHCRSPLAGFGDRLRVSTGLTTRHKPAPVVRDRHAGSMCNFCARDFNAERRHHFCRGCGIDVCRGCSRHVTRPTGQRLRLCMSCKEEPA